MPDVSAAVSNAGAIARDVTTLLEQDGKPGELLTFTLYTPTWTRIAAPAVRRLHPNFRGHQKIADLLFGATN